MDTTQSKNCDQCGNSFLPINRAGYEQKYCSKSCRYKAGNNRRLENFTNKYIGSNETKNNIQAEPIRQNNNFGTYSDIQIELIKEIERLRYDNEIAKLENYYSNEFNKINSQMELIKIKLDEQEYDDDNEIEKKQEINPIISGILNTEFGKQLAQHPSIGKIVETFLSK